MSTNNTYILDLTPNPEVIYENIFIDTADPNDSATIFEPNEPQTEQKTYIGNDGSLWIWNGTEYIKKEVQLTTNQHGEFGRIYLNNDAPITMQTYAPIPMDKQGIVYGTSVTPVISRNALLLKKNLLYQIDSSLIETFANAGDGGRVLYEISFDGVNWNDFSTNVLAFRRPTNFNAGNNNNQGSLMVQYQPSQDTYIRLKNPGLVGTGSSIVNSLFSWLDAYVIGVNENPMVLSNVTATASDLFDGFQNQTLTITYNFTASASGWFENPFAITPTSAGTTFTGLTNVPRLIWINSGANTIQFTYTVSINDDPALVAPNEKNATYTLDFSSLGQIIALGKITTRPAFIGYLQNSGGTNITSWSNNQQTLGGAVASPARIGAFPGYEIIYTGAPTGTNGFTIAGTGTSMGPWNAGGTVTLTATQVVNQTVTVQNGATLNIGIPGSYATAVGMQGYVVVQSGGVVNWQSRDSNQMWMNVNSGGVFNINGNAPLNTGDSYQLQTSVVNGILNISNAQVQMFSGYGMSGSGIVNINAGATFFATPGSPTGVTFRIAGTGTGVAGNQAAAVQWANNLTVSNRIEVVDDATIGAWNPFTYTGQLVINADKVLRFGNGNTNHYLTGTQAASNIQGTLAAHNIGGGGVYINTANYAPQGYFSSRDGSNLIIGATQSVKGFRNFATAPTWSGSITLNAAVTLTEQDLTPSLLWIGGAGALNIPTGSNFITQRVNGNSGTVTIGAGASVGGGRATNSAFGGGLTMSAATSRLRVEPITTSSCGRLTCTAFTASSGFTVDITSALNAGTYTILTRTSGANTIPTIGVNNSGLTPSFQWASNNLVMTLV